MWWLGCGGTCVCCSASTGCACCTTVRHAGIRSSTVGACCACACDSRASNAAPQAQRAMPAAAPTSAPAASSESNENIVEVEIQKMVMQAAPAPAAPAPATQQSAGQSSGGQVAQSQSGVGPRGGQPGATIFEDYERTPFVYTSEDRVSTFSLDTDRTSYHLALNWARSGYDVEPDSVRSEEWINAFNYNYAQPSRDDSFAVHTDLIPHPLDDDKVLARVGFQALSCAMTAGL